MPVRINHALLSFRLWRICLWQKADPPWAEKRDKLVENVQKKGDLVMSKILVVYCSMTGNTKAAAEAIAEGARDAGAQVTLKKGTDAEQKDLLECNAVALGSYDAFSYMGGGLKDFLDRTYYPTKGQVTDKPYGAFITHGGGGKAIESIESITKSFKLMKIAEPVLVKGKPEAQAIAGLKALGAKLATVTVK